MVGYVGTHGTNPAVRKLQYDAVRDFTPIAMVGGTPNILVVTPSVPASDVKSFVAYVKANPKKLNWGTGGIGLLNHLALEQFRAAAGLEQEMYAHYKGIGPAITDMLGGQINVLMPGAAAHPRGEAETPRRHRPEAPSAAAPDPDLRGIGLQGLRRRTVVRHRRAGGAACRDHAEAERRDQQGDRLAGAARAPLGRGDHADADDAGGVRRLHARRYRALDRARARAPHLARRLASAG
jgi:hypothetical protein